MVSVVHFVRTYLRELTHLITEPSNFTTDFTAIFSIAHQVSTVDLLLLRTKCCTTSIASAVLSPLPLFSLSTILNRKTMRVVLTTLASMAVGAYAFGAFPTLEFCYMMDFRSWFRRRSK